MAAQKTHLRQHDTSPPDLYRSKRLTCLASLFSSKEFGRATISEALHDRRNGSLDLLAGLDRLAPATADALLLEMRERKFILACRKKAALYTYKLVCRCREQADKRQEIVEGWTGTFDISSE